MVRGVLEELRRLLENVLLRGVFVGVEGSLDVKLGRVVGAAATWYRRPEETIVRGGCSNRFGRGSFGRLRVGVDIRRGGLGIKIAGRQPQRGRRSRPAGP